MSAATVEAVDRIAAGLFFLLGLFAIGGGLLTSQGVFPMFNAWADVLLVIVGFNAWFISWALVVGTQFQHGRRI
jgi:hypothetical protein